MSRTIGMKQSRSNITTVNRRTNQQLNDTSPDRIDKTSPKGNLFKQNKETLEMMLIRKLRMKYIETNSVFATSLVEEQTNPLNMLQNTYISNGNASKKYNPNSSIEYGSLPIRQSSNQGGRTRNAPQKLRQTVGNSVNTLPRIRNPSNIDVGGVDQYVNHQTPQSRRDAKSSSQMAPLLRKSMNQPNMTGYAKQPITVTLTISGNQFLNYITAEVQKFVSSKRINESNIRELDQKVQMESYMREKKEAILEDRKNGGGDQQHLKMIINSRGSHD